MANSTMQAREMIKTHGGLSAQLRDDPNVFIAIDLLWYPVEGNNKICVAPDVMVVLGRPRGDRRSYLQWQEDNIAPQVVFEFLSHANTHREMIEKFRFYEYYGVVEYYLYDPENGTLEGWIRRGDKLEPIEDMHGWVSPLLGIRFELERGELVLSHPDGTRFATFEEITARAEEEHKRAEKLAIRLRELGVDPDTV
jgi:hypothetical protein